MCGGRRIMEETLKDFRFNEHLEEYGVKELSHTNGEFVRAEVIRSEAINILKKNKEINTADWIEFFNIEEEFANECLGDANVLEDEA